MPAKSSHGALPGRGLLAEAIKALPARRIALLYLAGAVLAAPLFAADYRSISQGGAVLFDGPSVKAQPLYVATAALPVEIISSDGTWFKVRDPNGELAWVDGKSLSDRRMVVVTAPVAQIREKPDDASAVVLQVAQGVGLEYADQAGAPPGWVHVRHHGGAEGYVRITQLWGV